MEKQIGQKLYELSRKNETADAIVHALASRERLRHFIDIRRLRYALKKEGFKIVDSDYMNLWKEWEKMGLGSIVRGRIGNDDRFIMNYDMRKVAEASLKGTELSPEDKRKVSTIAVAQSITKKRGRKKKAAPQMSKPAPIQKKEVVITIQTDSGVEMKLPKNITKADIQELARALNEMS